MSVPMKDSGVDWLGEVPSHWSVFRFKQSTTSCQNGLWGADPNGVDDIECVRVADFNRPALNVNPGIPTLRAVTEKERNGRLLKRGNLLIEKSGGGENQPVGQVVLYDRDASAICSNFVAKIELAPGMDQRFWNYQHHAAYAARVNVKSIKQTSGIQNLDHHQYLDELAVFPSAIEQTAIADHLDRATTRIDTLIAKKTRFIELLREKRQALITHAVTKGLDASVPMKESGMEWVGAIPSHWEVRPFYSFATEVDSPNTGLKERNLLSLSYGQLVRKDMDRLEGLTPASFEGYNIIEPNDIVFRLTDLQNDQRSLRSARAQERGIITSAYITVRPKASPRFFEYLMRSYDTSKVFYGIGGGIRQSMKFADLKRLPVVVPPISEMDAIASHLDRATTRIDTLITKTERSIELLREKRTALITAAVTGKLDLRPAA